MENAEGQHFSAAGTTQRFRFSLPTLLALVAVAAGCLSLWLQQRHSHRLDSILVGHRLKWVDIPEGSLRVQVRELKSVNDVILRQIDVEVVGPAFIRLNHTDGSGGGVGVGTVGRSSDTPFRVQLLLLASKSLGDDAESIGVDCHLNAYGNRFYGSDICTIPNGMKMTDAFQMQIKPGLHRRGKPIILYRLNGQACRLVVD